VARRYYALGRFISNGLVVCQVFSDGDLLATLIPRRRDFSIHAPPPPGLTVVLPRFAYLRRVDDVLVLACPGAACELILHGAEPAAWLAAAAQPVTVGNPPDEADEQIALYRLAAAHGLLEVAGDPEPPARAPWEFHDRLFHQAARSHDDLVVRGGTFRFIEAFPPPPAVRPPHPGEDIVLPAPGWTGSDSLRAVMDRRRSRREMSDHPVPLAAVGEVMYRVARTTGSARTGPQDTIRRPYPSGGSLHELEFYLSVGACDGLAPGFYHYRGEAHSLTRLRDATGAAEAMLTTTADAWNQPDAPPQVLVVIASRLPRLAWKYAGIAYKVSLLNAGVVIQSLSLVTEDMGLAGCAVGSGDPGLFARATGCDPFEETSIAEFGFGLPSTAE
jgi:SagB-type dehydrogenase family enzyme